MFPRKNILIIGLVSIILIVLGIFVYTKTNFHSDFFRGNENLGTGQNIYTGEVNQNTGIQKIDSIAASGDYFVFTSAIIKSDQKGCDQLSNYILKNVCLENTSKKIVDLRAAVNSAVFVSKDAKLCDILSGNDLKNDCRSKIQNTISFDGYLNSCKNEKNLQICDKISGTDNKNFCRKRCGDLIELDSLLLEYGKNKDQKVCEKSKKSSVVAECKKYVSGYDSFDKIVSEAKKENDVKICTQLTDNYLVEDCIRVFNTNRK